ncbi:Yip1-like protein [Paenibacillus methanolicus]|uniref:Yip1-like protein n=2 Tax=Paenibacillus methanolicus TaxID=582686 RepID=A0A5S5CEQ9_9BACL|nr:Yip1-like protein [Paenibacillus methanolicus]
MFRWKRELVSYPFYLIMHPFNGYWDLKYERGKKTNLILSFAILVLLALTNIMRTQYSGFLVNVVNPDNMNSLMEIVYVVVPVLFWCVANWSLTTLMDGEGKFEEIFTSTCFALIPLVLIHFPWIWLSNVISLQETSFYHFSGSVAMAWFLFLMFVGNMTVHQYSPMKTIATGMLTILAMGFMAFLCMLFFSLMQQIVAFISIIYQEIVLRS